MSTNGQAGARLVTVIPGDGIGPEVVNAAIRVVEASGAKIAWDTQKAGADVFAAGNATGVSPEAIESIRRTRVVLKGPLTTPVGYGEKSANVTLRKLFETYANVRPTRELPGVVTPFTGRGIDMTIVRENIEDLYAGIEHMQSPGVAQCLKLITRKGSEKVIRYAFALAKAEGRTRVTCVTKANIMKLTEGLFKQVFEEVAAEYPEIESEHMLVDNCAHQMVRHPERFGLIVTTNLNGDILSDLASGLIGGLGFAPGANVGDSVAIFEPVHGAAPDIAGQGIANPKAMMLSAVMLLRHIGEIEAATKIENAVHVTLAEGKLTRDAVTDDEPCLNTEQFADAVIANLGRSLPTSRARKFRAAAADPVTARPATRRVIGADIFVESELLPAALGPLVEELAEGCALKLKMISNRGTQVYPLTGALTDCVDHYRCRFALRQPAAPDAEATDTAIIALLNRFASARVRWVHVEKLQEFDGSRAYTKAQGEE
jgi:isocitrate dehydrogenase